MLRRSRLLRILALVGAVAAINHERSWCGWSVQHVGAVALAPPASVTITEMSGVSYMGPSMQGGHRFVAAQENSGQLAAFELRFDAMGAITMVDSIETIAVNSTLDYEGIAVVDSLTVFLSEEDLPGVRKFSLVDGTQLQSAAIPPVFAHRRGNRGFESLTLSADGTTLWTANEEALSVDGPAATTATGSTIRLLQLQVDGDDVSATSQFAYEVEPIHASGLFNTQQNGLADLAALPDGSLLALERSFALAATPTYLSRIFRIEIGDATDLSATAFEGGLDDQSFIPVVKELLWEGTADGASGQNLEGLALGPQLDNGDWVLVGVVDNGDLFSGNTLVTFRLQDDSVVDFNADFDSNGVTDGADFLLWQRGYGAGPGASRLNGDGNGDGQVDQTDLHGWESAVASAKAPPGEAVPEPMAGTMSALAILLIVARRLNIRTG